MDFFKAFKRPPTVKQAEPSEKINKAIEDQMDIGGGKTDDSIENYRDELNNKLVTRKIIGNENKGPIVSEDSWEADTQPKELLERFNALRLRYNDIKDEIKEKSKNVGTLRESKEGAERASKNLTFKEIVGESADVTDFMRNAEDRVERLTRRVRQEEGDIFSLQRELEEVENILTLMLPLLPEEPAEGDEQAKEKNKYPFHLN